MSPNLFRIGLGYDSHRLEPGGPLRLGGVNVPAEFHAVGHSDGDALLHAIVDALLGAAALGEIGELFPDTDLRNRGRDSAAFLAAARDRLRGNDWHVINLDCVVLLESPKLLPFRDALRMRIAEVLEIPAHDVGLKAKTGEKVDAVGRGEAVVAQCVALIEKRHAKTMNDE